jgi:hypothetical protein
MNVFLTFIISYVVTTGIYYVWYRNSNNLESKDFLKKILYFALSMAVMFGALYYLTDELEIWFVILMYIGVVMVSDNVMIHTYFPKGNLNIKKIDYFLPGAINTAIIFGVIYLLFF